METVKQHIESLPELITTPNNCSNLLSFRHTLYVKKDIYIKTHYSSHKINMYRLYRLNYMGHIELERGIEPKLFDNLELFHKPDFKSPVSSIRLSHRLDTSMR
jgi:hypothetical protein